MNHAQVETCFDFITNCIKNHGKQLPIKNVFKQKFKCWEIEIGERSFALKEYLDGDRSIIASDLYLNVFHRKIDNTFNILEGKFQDDFLQEKRLIETLMLFNGDISHKEYANEA